jgi:SH3-like domain-containing protein
MTLSVWRGLSIAVLATLCQPAAAAEFRSVGETAAVLYDAASLKTKKLHVLGSKYPVEIIVTVEGWSKVRDANGELSWIETRNLTTHRTVMVKAKIGEVRQSPDDKAPLVFQTEHDVLLDLVELTGSGWARVAHNDGQGGYIKLGALWGV